MIKEIPRRFTRISFWEGRDCRCRLLHITLRRKEAFISFTKAEHYGTLALTRAARFCWKVIQPLKSIYASRWRIAWLGGIAIYDSFAPRSSYSWLRRHETMPIVATFHRLPLRPAITVVQAFVGLAIELLITLLYFSDKIKMLTTRDAECP